MDINYNYMKMDYFTCCSNIIFIFFFGCLLTLTNGQQHSIPIQIRSLEVSPDSHYTKVSVTFTSLKSTDVKWTINDGFSPKVIHPSTLISLTRNNRNLTSVASVTLPRELSFQDLRIHITCLHSSFQVHAEFKISHLTPATFESIDQFTLFLPRESEIGVSSKGKSRFHIYVNTTGSAFSFGMIQTEAHFVGSDSAEVNTTIAYAFPVTLPGMDNGSLRIKPMFSTSTEYHADILLNNPNLHKTGGVISISATCTSTSSLVNRLDVQHTLYIHPRPGTSAVPIGSLAFVKEMSPTQISVPKQGSVILRCTSFGNPTPSIQLYRKKGLQLEKSSIPAYVSSLPYEISAVFQMVNVTITMGGHYVCVASNSIKKIQIEHTIFVLKS